MRLVFNSVYIEAISESVSARDHWAIIMRRSPTAGPSPNALPVHILPGSAGGSVSVEAAKVCVSELLLKRYLPVVVASSTDNPTKFQEAVVAAADTPAIFSRAVVDVE